MHFCEKCGNMYYIKIQIGLGGAGRAWAPPGPGAGGVTGGGAAFWRHSTRTH